MHLDAGSIKPIYMQIADWIENEILNENFQVDEKVHSQYTLADLFNINPATAAKGLNILSDEGVLYTKRGLGKFVAEDARKRIIHKRKSETLQHLILDVVEEAKRLQVDEQELIALIQGKMRAKGEKEQ